MAAVKHLTASDSLTTHCGRYNDPEMYHWSSEMNLFLWICFLCKAIWLRMPVQPQPN
jgi:hypothetical protein